MNARSINGAEANCSLSSSISSLAGDPISMCPMSSLSIAIDQSMAARFDLIIRRETTSLDQAKALKRKRKASCCVYLSSGEANGMGLMMNANRRFSSRSSMLMIMIEFSWQSSFVPRRVWHWKRREDEVKTHTHTHTHTHTKAPEVKWLKRTSSLRVSTRRKGKHVKTIGAIDLPNKAKTRRLSWTITTEIRGEANAVGIEFILISQ